MRPTFFGLEIARTGLTVSQRGLDVTGHNIANVDTEGYTRQRIVNTAYEPYSVLNKLRPVELALVGSGARTLILDQIRSKYLDQQYRSEACLANYWRSRTEGLEYMETLFEGADSSSGLAQYINYFFDSVNTATLNTSDREQRIIVKQAGESLAMSLNLMYDRLVEQQKGHSDAVQVMTDQINDIAKNIAAVNKTIYAYEINGQIANDLRDKRNLLLDQLSELVDIEYEESVDNRLTVWIGGQKDNAQMLVSHLQYRELKCDVETDSVTGLEYNTPRWIDSGGDLAFNLGKLRSSFDLASVSTKATSTTTVNPGLPYFIDQLNILARMLVQSVNAIHNAGWTHPAATGVSQTGIDFFFGGTITGYEDILDYDYNPDGTIIDSDGSGTIDDSDKVIVVGQRAISDVSTVTAGNIRLSDELITSEYNVASSTVRILNPGDPGYDPTVTDVGNNKNIRAIFDLLNRQDLQLSMPADAYGNPAYDIPIGSVTGYVSGLITEVATTLNHCKKMDANEQVQILNAQNSRLSVSGVSLDEEMVNMIKYQHAYNGASRVITTMDEALDVLINRTGLVGR